MMFCPKKPYSISKTVKKLVLISCLKKISCNKRYPHPKIYKIFGNIFNGRVRKERKKGKSGVKFLKQIVILYSPEVSTYQKFIV